MRVRDLTGYHAPLWFSGYGLLERVDQRLDLVRPGIGSEARLVVDHCGGLADLLIAERSGSAGEAMGHRAYPRIIRGEVPELFKLRPAPRDELPAQYLERVSHRRRRQ